MQSLLEVIQQFWTGLQHGQLPELGRWNYLLLSLLIIWQGPVATLLGGAAASAGLLRPSLVFLAGIVGNLTADIIWYTVGRSGNVDRLFENGRLGVHRSRFTVLKNGMRRHGTKILLMSKLSPGLAVPAMVTAGLTRLRWRRWFPIVFIGESIWTGTLVLIGFYATEAIKRIEQGMHLLLAGLTFVLILVFAWLVPRWLRQSDPFGMTAGEEGNVRN